MMIVSAFGFIALINFRARFQKLFRFFRHSDCQRFFFRDVLYFRIFTNILRDLHQAEMLSAYSFNLC